MPSVIAAALLIVSAGLAVGGSFARFSVFRIDVGGPATTYGATGWGSYIDPASDVPSSAVPTLGIPLVVGAVAGLVAAILILASRTAGAAGRPRLLGVGAAGLLCGTAASIWLSQVASMRNDDALAATGRPFQTFETGPGAWLELAAGVLALAAIVILLVAGRGPAPMPVPARAFGPGPMPPPGYPAWPGGPPQPGPPPGWSGLPPR